MPSSFNWFSAGVKGRPTRNRAVCISKGGLSAQSTRPVHDHSRDPSGPWCEVPVRFQWIFCLSFISLKILGLYGKRLRASHSERYARCLCGRSTLSHLRDHHSGHSFEMGHFSFRGSAFWDSTGAATQGQLLTEASSPALPEVRAPILVNSLSSGRRQ